MSSSEFIGIKCDLAVLLSRSADAAESLCAIEDRQVRTPSPDADLLRQLAAMKVMMEQMRLEKEQQEQAAKKKVEEEAKQQADMAALIQVRDQHQSHWFGVDRLKGMGANCLARGVLEPLQKNGEIILHVVLQPIGNGPEMDTSYILTNQHYYNVRCGCDYKGKPDELSRIYSFTQPLNSIQANMLLTTLHKTYKGSDAMPTLKQSLADRMKLIEYVGLPMHYQPDKRMQYMDPHKKFESVIRLIPGSYQNGDWRQLDGFFGMYYNETTMEVTEVPPPSL